MDYNILKKAIKSAYGEIQLFFQKEEDSINLTEGGFYQAIRNNSLKISTLEEISKKLGLPMSHWWQKEELKESKQTGESDTKRIQELEKYNHLLERQINLLEDKLEKYEGKKKEVI